MLETITSDEPEIIVLGVEYLDEDELPLTEEETLQASYYWYMLGAPSGVRKRCRCGLKRPRLGLLSDDRLQSQKAAQQHLELGMASKCPVCSVLHLRIAEVHSHHSAFLYSRLIRDSHGAIRSARQRCAVARGL